MFKHKWLLISFLVVISCIGGIWMLLRSWDKESKQILARCIDYPPDTGFADCYGVISIWSSGVSDAPRYVVIDHKHGWYALASIDNFDQFKVVDGYLYVKDHSPGNGIGMFEGQGIKYIKSIYRNNDKEQLLYDRVSDIPIYHKVNTQ